MHAATSLDDDISFELNEFSTKDAEIFQLAYYVLQKFLNDRLENYDTYSIIQPMRDSLRILVDFLNTFGKSFHKTALIYSLREKYNNPSIEQNRIIEALEKQTKQEFKTLMEGMDGNVSLAMNLFMKIWSYPATTDELRLYHSFSGVHTILRVLNETIISLKKLPTSEQAASVLFNFLTLKFEKARENGYFQFHQYQKELYKLLVLTTKLRDKDSLLQCMIDDENYVFSVEDRKQINLEQYQVIKKHPIVRLFLLLGLELNVSSNQVKGLIEASNTFEQQKLLELAETIKKDIPLDSYKRLLEACFSNANLPLSHLPQVLEATNRVGGKAPKVFEELIDLFGTCQNWEDAKTMLPDLFWKAWNETFPVLSDEEVFASYQKVSPDVSQELLPSSQALEQAIRVYQEANQYAIELRGNEAIQNFKLNKQPAQNMLQARLEHFVGVYNTTTSLEEKRTAEAQIWAILRETFRLVFDILPNTAQMMNAHLILNTEHGRTIAQIKTGEGKSALQALMMAFRALTSGKKQFNVTTAEYLAERDVNKFTPYYRILGLICTKNVSTTADDRPFSQPIYGDARSYVGHIVYGTASAFQFGYMKGRYLENKELFDPKYTDIYVDEVDALVIDAEQSTARISGIEILYGWPQKKQNSLYADIGNYVSVSERQGQQHSVEGLINLLISWHYFTKQEVLQKENHYMITKWYISAVRALQIKKDEDYVIDTICLSGLEQKKIVIVDRKGTGELKKGMEWQSGLHQIICAREGVPVTSEKHLQCSIPHSVFFNLFPNIFAVTGTVGGKHCYTYLTHAYPNISIMTLPRYRESNAQLVPHIISQGKKAHYDQLIKDIINARKKRQALLFLFETIHETQEFYQYAASKGHESTILTGTENPAIFDNRLVLAGLPNRVTLATFIAGRGADIAPTNEVESNGGLGVYLCAPPENERVIGQNFGRTGRQGRQGFYAYRFDRDLLIKTIASLASGIEDKSLNAKKRISNPILATTIKELADIWRAPSAIDLTENLTDDSEGNSTQSTIRDISDVQVMTKTHQLRYFFSQVSDEKLLNFWEIVREMLQLFQTEENLSHIQFKSVLFSLQTLVYAISHHPNYRDTRINESLAKRYHMLDDKLKRALKVNNLDIFKKYIGETMLEFAHKCGIRPEEIEQQARETENLMMLECLEKAKPRPVERAHAVSLNVPQAFFALPSDVPTDVLSEESSSVPKEESLNRDNTMS